jgi:hypothetical protein
MKGISCTSGKLFILKKHYISLSYLFQIPHYLTFFTHGECCRDFKKGGDKNTLTQFIAMLSQ